MHKNGSHPPTQNDDDSIIENVGIFLPLFLRTSPILSVATASSASLLLPIPNFSTQKCTENGA